MSGTVITVRRVLEAIDAAVERRGRDWTYPTEEGGSCHYRWDSDDVADGRVEESMVGQAACLVAAVMVELGLDLDVYLPPVEMADVSDYGVPAIVVYDGNCEAAVNLLDGTVEPHALSLLTEGQSMQDGGKSWGETSDIVHGLAMNLVQRGRVDRSEVPELVSV